MEKLTKTNTGFIVTRNDVEPNLAFGIIFGTLSFFWLLLLILIMAIYRQISLFIIAPSIMWIFMGFAWIDGIVCEIKNRYNTYSMISNDVNAFIFALRANLNLNESALKIISKKHKLDYTVIRKNIEFANELT